MKIITNNKYRDILSAFELTESELKDFDYLDEGEGSFFRYKGRVYDLGEFLVTSCDELKGWDGFSADSFFSGIAIKFDDSCDAVKVALCLS